MITTKYHIIEFNSTITMTVVVHNTCLISPGISSEISKLCDTCFLDDILKELYKNI